MISFYFTFLTLLMRVTFFSTSSTSSMYSSLYAYFLVLFSRLLAAALSFENSLNLSWMWGIIPCSRLLGCFLACLSMYYRWLNDCSLWKDFLTLGMSSVSEMSSESWTFFAILSCRWTFWTASEGSSSDSRSAFTSPEDCCYFANHYES